MSAHYETLKLEKGMYGQAGRSFTQMLEDMDPSENYRVNPADGALTQISEINRAIYDRIRMGEVRKRWVETTDGKQIVAFASSHETAPQSPSLSGVTTHT